MAVAVRLTRSAAPDDSGDLFERYSERIHAYCLHVLRDRTEAEDAVQTTFLNAHRALRRGVVPLHEYAWLHTIAKNACRMQQRTKGRRAPVANVDVDTIPRSDEDDDATELRAALDDALGRLPESQRRAVLLREWYGLSPVEIAPRLGLSVPATYALLTRARRSLAGALTATVRGPLAILDLSGLADALRGLKAYVGGAAAKTAVAAAVVTASVGVGGGVVVDRALRGSPDPAPGTTTPAPSVVRSDAGDASRVAQTPPVPLGTTTRPAAGHVGDATSMPRTAPTEAQPPSAGTPTGSAEPPVQPSEPTGSGESPAQPPRQRDAGSLPAPSAPAPIAPVLPLPPLPELPGTDELPVPVDTMPLPLPPLPDADPPPAEPLPPLPRLPLP